MGQNELASRPFDGDSRRLNHAVLGALLLGFVHQWFFIGKPFGLSVPLYMTLLYVYYFVVAGRENRSQTPFAWVLLGGIALLSLTYAWFDSGVFKTLNVLALPALAVFHAVLHAGRTGMVWYRKEAAGKTLYFLLPGTVSNISVPFRLFKGRAESSLGRRRLAVAVKIAAGLVIALPFAFVVTGLLISADKAFQQVLSGIPDWWTGMHPAEALFRGIWMTVVFLVVFGFVWGLASGKTVSDSAAAEKQGERLTEMRLPDLPGMPPPAPSPGTVRTKPFAFDPVINHTVLIVINLVYLLFAVVQFSYLFGAWDGVLPDGQTYAEHARSGFFELVVVSIINFLLLSATLTWSRPEGKGQGLLQRWLLTALLAGTLVMLVSAHVRMSLYEEAYGHSVLRFLVQAFLLYMAVLLAAALYRVWREGVSLVRMFVLISLAAWLAINCVGVEQRVAERNVARYEAGADLDVFYLSRLSSDVVPALVPLIGEHEQVRNHLQERYTRLKEDKRSFLSFNLSRYRALKQLEREFQ